nr:hypothetical protein [Phycisphaerae bacterium]NIT58904.1 hypothetical protein [Fodinibius sp.]NIW98114.1 hypothetical protein [Phycisphaerae bacterium]NIY27487.1 hypothetical protein [Fodinibius sp.]
MRVYSKIVINIETGETECAEWTDDYSGPIAECKGGGGGDGVDKKYNKGMLEISRRQQEMADEMFNMFKYGVTYDPTAIDPDTGKTLGETRGYD